MTKQLHFEGSFYPREDKNIRHYFDHFNTILKDNLSQDWQMTYPHKKRAIIAPHAGYVYSGFTANMAYQLLATEKPKRAIVIGPSHRIAFEGLSILSGCTHYNTPFGTLQVDKDYQEELREYFKFGYDQRIHQEHSTETQMPFIKYYLDVPILEVIYSKIQDDELGLFIEYLLNDPDNVVIISTDLSHFYTKKEANKKDSICIESIKTMNLSLFQEGCEACGGTGVKALVRAAKMKGLIPHILDYRTSADYSGDEDSVVGYLSVLFTN